MIRDTLLLSHRFGALAVLLVSLGLSGPATGQSTPAAEQPAPALSQSRNLAAGFSSLAKGARVVIMPTDIELFSISAGGVLEPKADWTQAASKFFQAALIEKEKRLGLAPAELSEADSDDLAEVNSLHAAVARAIALHHFGGAPFRLPTKEGQLDWSLGDAVRAIKDKTGAEYALFSWVRDSYASSERVATMVVLALFGVGIPGGSQIGYASLVDLNTGQVLWFNRLARVSGDLREEKNVPETLDALLQDFPLAK